jgi:hypothetical protein
MYDGGSLKLRLSAHASENNYINNGGNFGIDETSPDGKLHVKQSTDDGNAIVVDSGTDGGRIDVLTVQEAGNERWNLSFEGNGSTNDLTLNSNSTNNILNIKPGGNVGIGTDSPSNIFHSHGVTHRFSSDSYNVVYIQADANNDGSNDDIVLQFTTGNSNTVKGELRYDESDDKFEISAGDNQNHLTIDSSGNVGIGETSPSERLHIGGDYADFRLYSRTGIEIGTLAFNEYFNGSAWVNDDSGIVSGAVRFSDSRDSLEFGVRAGGSTAGYSSTHMTIKSTGRVGIGTNDPASQLHIFSDAGGVDTILEIECNASNASAMLVLDSHTDRDSGVYFQENGTYKGGMFNDASADATVIMDGSNANVMYLKGGNVGIGTTSPTHTLHLVGDRTDIKFTRTGYQSHYIRKDGSYLRIRGEDDSTVLMELRNNDSSNLISFPNSNVGIGTDSPSEKLEVYDGDILVSSGRGVRANGGQEMIRFDSSDGVKINSGNAERLRVKTSGQIETFYGDNSYNLYINGLASSSTKGILMAVGGSSGTVDQMLFRDGNSHNCGAITSDASANTTNYGGTSDYRLKENEEIISDGIERIKKLKPYRFNFITAPDQTQDGFFAHELAEHIPEAVVGEKDAMEDGEIKLQMRVKYYTQ